MRGPPAAGLRRWLAATLVVAAVLLLLAADRGWDPDDEGALAQSAERVLQGEVPHRDFDELYTGLLTYSNAAAFALGGIRLTVLRVPFLLLALGWVAAMFGLARRLVPPAGAAALTLLALAWSVPNNPSPMPSWYNLFLATFGALALARWVEDRTGRWLLLAGLLGGLSFLVKVSGLFFVAGAGLFLLEASRPDKPAAGAGRGPAIARGTITVGWALFILFLWRAVGQRGYVGDLFHFVLPAALVALGLAVREWTAPPVSGRLRFQSLARVASPFVGGIALAVLPFAVMLAAVGGLDDAIRGVFLTSFRRLDFAGMKPPPAFWIGAVVPLVLLLRPRADPASRSWRRSGLVATGLLLVVLVAASSFYFPQRVIWQSVRNLAPVLGLVTGVVVALGPERLGWPPARQLIIVLLGAVAVLTSLIQFPFASPTYFYYVAPLVFLAAAGVVRVAGKTPGSLQLAVVGFYVAFAVLEVLPGSPSGLTLRAQGRSPPVRLELARGGLLVRGDEAVLYGALVPRLQALVGGRPIWAGPDAPEVYFLGGFRNPTRALYEFLAEPASSGEGLLRLLDRKDVAVIAVNTRPEFSGSLGPELLDSLARRFPAADTIGRFVVRWRDR